MPNCTGLFDAPDLYTRQCTFVECYECLRGFCVACQSPWHPGSVCVSFLFHFPPGPKIVLLGEIKLFDDEYEIKQTLKKAEQNNWTRCPACVRIVEKVVN